MKGGRRKRGGGRGGTGYSAIQKAGSCRDACKVSEGGVEERGGGGRGGTGYSAI